MDVFCAVLTGDLVRSTDLPADTLATAFDALEEAAAEMSVWQGAAWAKVPAVQRDARFTRSRGDGWQIVLARPELGLRAALFLRAALRAIGQDLSTRIAIATGEGHLPAGGNLNQATGPVFVASGRALDGLSPHRQMVHASGGWAGAATRLADHISQDWTVAQARAMKFMLWRDGRTHNTAAHQLGITRQAVAQSLTAAGFPALRDSLTLIEAAPDAG
jgi:hypothetical protein